MPFEEDIDYNIEDYRLPLLEKLKSYREKVRRIHAKLTTSSEGTYDLSKDAKYLDEIGDLFNSKTKDFINESLKEIIEDEMQYAEEAINNFEIQIANSLPDKEIVEERKDFMQEYESLLQGLSEKDRYRFTQKKMPLNKFEKEIKLFIEKNDITLSDEEITNYLNKFKTYIVKPGDDLIEHFNEILQGYGFVTTPKELPFGALFPKKDWVEVYSKDTDQTFDRLNKKSKKLMNGYDILTDETYGLLRGNQNLKSDKQSKNKIVKFNKLKCVGISWAMIGTRKNTRGVEKYLYAPVVGFNNNNSKTKTNDKGVSVLYEKMAIHAGLPRIEEADELKIEIPEKHNQNNEKNKINRQYFLMMDRFQKLSVNYEVRNTLGLRLPARQAMLSYAVFRPRMGKKNTPAPLNQNNDNLGEIDLLLNRWDVFQCAEPAALITASSLFSQGQDVSICYPFEAEFPSPLSIPRPKETCEWCATVELAFRSFKLPDYCQEIAQNDDSKIEREKQFDLTETSIKDDILEDIHTPIRNKTDLSGLANARRTTNLTKNAYSQDNLRKMEKIRKLFKQAGFLEEFLVKEQKTEHIYAKSMNRAEEKSKKATKNIGQSRS